ncbi:MAG: hypothetical protein N2691_00760 [Patescibacteria group bacterium]|nr:hypothetical protein [Patescibacteria group bacterium]
MENVMIRQNSIRCAVAREKKTGYRIANFLGIISPKIITRIVPIVAESVPPSSTPNSPVKKNSQIRGKKDIYSITQDQAD